MKIETLVKIEVEYEDELVDLQTTAFKLQDIISALAKSGGHYETEITYLKAAEDIVCDILHNKAF